MELLNRNTTDIRDKLILNIFLTTGMRIGGLININVKGVYDEKNTLFGSIVHRFYKRSKCEGGINETRNSNLWWGLFLVFGGCF